MLKKFKKILKDNIFIYKLYVFLLGFTKLNSDKDPILFRLYEKIIIYSEIKKLEKLVNKDIDIVYDCSVSALTLGDFCDFAMVARFLKKKKFNIRIIFINDNFRDDYYKKNLQKAKLRLNEYKLILKSFVNPKIHIINCNWNNYIEDKFDKNFTFFNSNVISRKPIYHHCFNFLHTILKKETKKFLNDCLLNKNSFFLNKQNNLPKKKYVSLGCRFNPLDKKKYWSRNLKAEEFLKIVNEVKKKYSGYQIMVISDKNGTNFFKKIAKKNNLKLLYSKERSNSYIGDGYLMLNSKCYFQFLGGGTVAFLIYSKLNFMWFSFLQQHHVVLNTKKKYCWWHKNKNFYQEMVFRNINIFLNNIQKINFL